MAPKNNPKKRLGDILIQDGLITPPQLERAVEVQRSQGGKLGDILVELGMCAEEAVLSALSKRTGLPHKAALSERAVVAPDVLARVPAETARGKNILPLSMKGNVLSVAVSDPFAEFDVVDALKIQTGCEIAMVLASEKEIRKAVLRLYPETTAVRPASVPGAGDAGSSMDTVLGALFENAAKAGADHIHLEPGAQALRVRYRVKGALLARPDIPAAHGPALAAWVKARARMNATERWLPQDGWLRWTFDGRNLDVRVTTVPTPLGEKIVFELTDTARSLPLDLEKLGLEAETRDAFRAMLESPRGLVVVTGPTGAGKTSTLYAALAHVAGSDRHIVTVEDPIERFLEGISQMQTRPDARLTLASGLHVARRLDPDVIYVSDVRDAETAEAAFQAAAGALVLAAVTAQDALGAVARLAELAVPPPVLAKSLMGVLAQRLLRKNCPDCQEARTLSLRQLMSQGVGGREMRAAKRADAFTLYRGRGCGQCFATGYLGATAVFEALTMTETVRRLIGDRAERGVMARETSERVTLREAAVNKALAGQTTVEEALRVGGPI